MPAPYTLYRVGKPRITETWIGRYNHNRGTGGLGTGVYAYATKAGATNDSDSHAAGGDQPVITLRDALADPLVITGPDRAPVRVNYFSRALSYIGQRQRNDPDYVERLRRETMPDDPDDPGVLVFPQRKFEPHMPERLAKYLSDHIHTMSLMLPTDGPWGAHDMIGVWETALDACESAARDCVDSDDGCSQPINHLLYPEYDGWYFTSHARGDSNTYGCVILKERIDECLGRHTGEGEVLDPEELNACFMGYDEYDLAGETPPSDMRRRPEEDV
jgi:hypothetical protein